MYTLPEKDRLRIISQSSLKNHLEGAISIEIEKMIASTLPPVPGMVRGLSEEEREKVFAKAIHQQRENFIKNNGDAF